MNREEDSIPWLREMVDEDLADLFAEDPEVVQAAVVRSIAAAVDDPDLEGRLIDLLDTSLEQRNDDSSASLCATIILGEIHSTRALGCLIRSLALDHDEVLQDAAQVALLRIGAPALEAILEAVEEGGDPRLNAAAYGLLGRIGVLQDEGILQSVKDFLEGRIEAERRASRGETALEPLFQAMAYLGDRRQLGLMKRILDEDYGGRHPGLQDSIELLEENTGGVPILPSLPPWEERYGWLFGDDREEARISRPGSPRASAGDEDDDDPDEPWDERALSVLYRGINAPLDAPLEEEEEDEGED